LSAWLTQIIFSELCLEQRGLPQRKGDEIDHISLFMYSNQIPIQIVAYVNRFSQWTNASQWHETHQKWSCGVNQPSCGVNQPLQMKFTTSWCHIW